MSIRTTVGKTAEGLALSLTPDLDWLRHPRTAYPVTLDPTVTPISDTFDTFVRDGLTTDQSGENDLWIGLYTPVGKDPKVTRSFITWNSSVLAGKQIIGATVKFFNFWSNSCDPVSWEIWPTTTASASTRWTNQPQWLGDRPSVTSTITKGGDRCSDDWATIDGRAFFQHFATANGTSAHMGIRATDEIARTSFK